MRGDEAGASGAVRVALKGDSRCEWPSRRTLSNMEGAVAVEIV
jgi:hypothetical protein